MDADVKGQTTQADPDAPMSNCLPSTILLDTVVNIQKAKQVSYLVIPYLSGKQQDI